MEFTKIALTGHSIVRNFGTFLDTSEKVLPNFGLDGTEVRCFGSGGCTISHTEERLRPKLMNFDPDAIIWMLGDNDIANTCMNLGGLAAILLNQACQFRRDESVPAVVCTLLPRYPGKYYSHRYIERAAEVNDHLVDQLERAKQTNTYPNVSLYTHKDFVFPLDVKLTERYWMKQVYFQEDGTHLNPDGNWKLYRSFRKLVIGLKPQV